MPTYQYQALNKQGKSQKGMIEADSMRLARAKVREQGLMLTEIKALKVSNKNDKVKLSRQALTLLTRQLATLIKAKLPVEEALRGVAEQSEKRKVKEIMAQVREKVLEGLSLSQALAEFPLAFPNLYISTVAAGEQTGQLDVVLLRLAEYVETQQRTAQKVKQALIYPSLMVFISFCIITFLLTFVVPKIINVFSSTGQTLPTMTLVLIHLSDFLKRDGLVLVLLICLLVFLAKHLLKKEHIKARWHELLLSLPFSSYFIRTISTARYSHTLAILSNAGVPILKAMDIASQLVNNLTIKDRLQQAKNDVKEGMSLSHALKQTKVFTAMSIHLIASGESSGELEEMLQYAATNQDDDINRLIATALTLFEPMIILFMGAVVLFIVLATLLPIFSMDQLVH